MPSRSNGFASASVASRNNDASASSGVMSLKMIPGFGKSGTSRIAALSRDVRSADEVHVAVISVLRTGSLPPLWVRSFHLRPRLPSLQVVPPAALSVTAQARLVHHARRLQPIHRHDF